MVKKEYFDKLGERLFSKGCKQALAETLSGKPLPTKYVIKSFEYRVKGRSAWVEGKLFLLNSTVMFEVYAANKPTTVTHLAFVHGDGHRTIQKVEVRIPANHYITYAYAF